MKVTSCKVTVFWLLSVLAALLPASIGCGGGGQQGGEAQLRVLHSFDLGALLIPAGFTGLAYDGTSLWYHDDTGTGQVHPVNPDTGAVGAPVTLGPSPHVHAVQSDAFWTHCGCGGSREAQLRSKTDVLLDEIDSETELAFPIGLRIRGIAYDELADVVWLHGTDRQTGERMFVGVDASGEPDVIVRSGPYDASIRSMTWDGTHIWAVVGDGAGQLIERIDVTTFTAVQQFVAPLSDVEWQGIAWFDGRLFVVGTTAAGAATLAELSL